MGLMNKLDLLSFNGMNLNPLPLEFTQEVTTTEWLGYILAKVNEVIDAVNSFESEANDYTDAQIASLDGRLRGYINAENDAQDKAVDAIRANIQSQIDDIMRMIRQLQDSTEWRDYTDAQVAKLREFCTNTFNALNHAVVAVNERVDTVQSQIRRLESVIEKGNLLVDSPVSGQRMSVQDALYELYDNYREWVTYEEAGTTAYTYQDIADMDKTVREFSYYAATLLGIEVNTAVVRTRI